MKPWDARVFGDQSILVRVFPDLRRFPQLTERAAALQASFGIWHKLAFCIVCLLAHPVGLMAEQFIGSLWPRRLPFALFHIPMQIIGSALCLLSGYLIVRGSVQRGLWQQLRARGEQVCLGCGYNLTGNVSGVCPECGAAVPNPDSANPGDGVH